MKKAIIDKHVKEADALVKGRNEFKTFLEERIELGNEFVKRPITTRTEFENCKRDVSNWDAINSEYLKHAFNNESSIYKNEYDSVNRLSGLYESAMGIRTNPIEEFKKKIQNKIDVLEQLDLKTEHLKSTIETRPKIALSDEGTITEANDNVFIVHGHNHEIQQAVARTIEKVGLNPIILGDQPNSGNTVIEKFEKYSNVGYAIVLLTDDDLV
jgi:Fe-S oxidoreductase